MRIVVLGPQGSGKGTQAELLSKKFDIPHISVGDILRANVKNKTELGRIAAPYLSKGALVPDKIVVNMLKDYIDSSFVIDGFPRNTAQAKAFEKVTDVEQILLIDIPDREAIRRISGRRSCECGAVYNIYTNPPKIQNLCDNCKKALYQRDDDKEETVRKRLSIYHNETEPILDFYERKGVLHRIDGEQQIEKVFEDILNILE